MKQKLPEIWYLFHVDSTWPLPNECPDFQFCLDIDYCNKRGFAFKICVNIFCFTFHPTNNPRSRSSNGGKAICNGPVSISATGCLNSYLNTHSGFTTLSFVWRCNCYLLHFPFHFIISVQERCYIEHYIRRT